MVPARWIVATGFAGLVAGLFFCLGWVYFYAFGKYDPLGSWLGVWAHAMLLILLAGVHTHLAKQARLSALVCGLAALGSTLVVLGSLPALAYLSDLPAGHAREGEPVTPFVGGGPALLAPGMERPATPALADAAADVGGLLSLAGLAACGVLIARSKTALSQPAGTLLAVACVLALVAVFNNPVLNTVAGVLFGVPIFWLGHAIATDRSAY